MASDKKSSAPLDEAVLERFQRAWSERDAESIAKMISEGCVYEASFGPEPWGQRFVGRETIRDGVVRQWAAAGRVTELVHTENYIFGNHALAHWVSSYEDADGAQVSVHGCDFYEFREGLFSKKIAYRKCK